MFKNLLCDCCGVVGPVLVNREGRPVHANSPADYGRCFACRVRTPRASGAAKS